MSRARSQQRTFLGIVALLRPHWTTDASLPLRIERTLASDRRLGSRDRRLYRELVYTLLRYLPWVEPLLDSHPDEAVRRTAWLAAELPAVKLFRDEVTAGLPPCPAVAADKAAVLGADAAVLNPAWVQSECPRAMVPPLRDALLARAPLWLRVQHADRAPLYSELHELGWPWRASTLVDDAIELPPGTDIARTRAFAAGAVEVQDIGSQLVLRSVGVPAGGHWLDACAGAGGKTLQLAALLGKSGRITARDVRPAALDELRMRASRAGVADRVAIGDPADPVGGFDGVLVDAPCSGSGTWRRAPHLRWSTTLAGVRSAAALQQEILTANAPRVRPGGLLVYATCSLFRTENEAVVAAFLAGAPGFSAERSQSILPPEPDGDGFFVAALRRAG